MVAAGFGQLLVNTSCPHQAIIGSWDDAPLNDGSETPQLQQDLLVKILIRFRIARVDAADVAQPRIVLVNERQELMVAFGRHGADISGGFY
jgi:hypothetical protein